MKRITITLTYDQANTIFDVLEWAFENENYSQKRRLFPKEQVDEWVRNQRNYNAYIRRLRTKIYNAIDDYIKQV